MSTNLELVLYNPSLESLQSSLDNVRCAQQRLLIIYDFNWIGLDKFALTDLKLIDSCENAKIHYPSDGCNNAQILSVSIKKCIVDCLQNHYTLIDSVVNSNCSECFNFRLPKFNLNKHNNIKQFLGQQFDFLHLDARLNALVDSSSKDVNDSYVNIDAFNLNNFVAMLGCLTKCGVALLRVDNAFTLPASLYFFLNLAKLNSDKIIYGKKKNQTNVSAIKRKNELSDIDSNAINGESDFALNDIIECFKTDSRILLTGYRGRGKTTLLGELITKLMLSQDEIYSGFSVNILIVAPSKNSIKPILSIMNLAGFHDVPRETFRFCPPEDITNYVADYKFIIIDEAASLPSKYLINVISSASTKNQKVLFSSTSDSYEGQGKSFVQLVDNYGFKVFNLNRSWRFSENDVFDLSVSQLCNPDMMFDIKGYEGEFLTADEFINEDAEKLINRRELSIANFLEDGFYYLCVSIIIDFSLLFSIYKMLSNSHYRTSPNDLSNILERGNEFYFIISGGKIVSLSLVVSEQLIKNEDIDVSRETPIEQLSGLIDGIMSGDRRPKGNLTIQGLLASYMCPEIGYLKIKRIVRIATLQNMRRKGLASKLVDNILDSISRDNIEINNNGIIIHKRHYNNYKKNESSMHSSKQKIRTENARKTIKTSFLAVSFGATPELINFWQSNGFYPVRLGLKQDKYRANYSCLMLRETLSTLSSSINKQKLKNSETLISNELSKNIKNDLMDLGVSHKILSNLSNRFMIYYEFYKDKIYKDAKLLEFNHIKDDFVANNIDYNGGKFELDNDLESLLLDLKLVVENNKDLVWTAPFLYKYILNINLNKNNFFENKVDSNQYVKVLNELDTVHLLKKPNKKKLAAEIYALLSNL